MLKSYSNYLNEKIDTEYTIICDVDETHLMDVSGKNNVKDSIHNELGWIKNINLISVDKQQDGDYKLTVSADQGTDIRKEFSWLDQSGIFLKKVL